MNRIEASDWLSQFVGKTLRVHAEDGRVFGGQLKCTDKVSGGWSFMFNVSTSSLAMSLIIDVDILQDRNIILSLAHEWRAPPAETIRKAVEDSGNLSHTVNWNSRYVGLIVIPGQHIVKIEFEESTFPGSKSTVTL